MIYFTRMLPIFETTWFVIAVQGGAAVLAFVGALILSSAIALNKGAKSNLGWALVAVGLVLIGMAEGNRLLDFLGLPVLPEWDAVKTAAGVVFIAAGAFVWRRLLKKTLS